MDVLVHSYSANQSISVPSLPSKSTPLFSCSFCPGLSVCLWAAHSFITPDGSRSHKILHTQLWQWHLAHGRARVPARRHTTVPFGQKEGQTQRVKERVEKKGKKEGNNLITHISFQLAQPQSDTCRDVPQTAWSKWKEKRMKEAFFPSAPATAENICRHMRHILWLSALRTSEECDLFGLYHLWPEHGSTLDLSIGRWRDLRTYTVEEGAGFGDLFKYFGSVT